MENPFRADTKVSIMRIIAFMCVLSALVIAILIVVLDRDLAGGAALVGAILTPAFIGKAMQSYAEGKDDTGKTTAKTDL